MSTFQMLDALIGLVFIFLLLSLICTALNEILENILKNRATDLEKGIKALLLPNNAADTENLMGKFYEHPIISGLYEGDYQTGSNKLPSYIPAANFAHALMDIILPATANNLSGAAGGGVPVPVGTIYSPPPSPQPLKSLEPLRNAILNWSDTPAKKAVVALLDAAGNDIDKAKSNIETWFNNSMDRVAGWYKRRVQWILMALGFLLACAMNADTIAIFKSLMNDPPLRNSLVNAAQEYAKSSPSTDTLSALRRVDQNNKILYALRLPIGWDWNENKDAGSRNVSENNYKTNYPLAIPWANNAQDWILLRNWLLKVIGWLITALAISLGSAFWFDTLNKIMVIRSTVKPHEKSQEEASEDRQLKK